MKTRMLFVGMLVLAAGLTVGAAVQVSDKAVDPVCGMSVTKAGAKWTYDYKGATYYFCSEGCKTSFAKEPEKYLAKTAEAKPMGGGMGMMHGQEPAHMHGETADACPMILDGVERKVENTKDGVIITLTSKDPETVKKIQDRLAKMKDVPPGMKKTSESGEMCADCPMKKK